MAMPTTIAPFSPTLALGFDQGRQLLQAWAAPGRPEVQQHPATTVVRQAMRLAVQIGQGKVGRDVTRSRPPARRQGCARWLARCIQPPAAATSTARARMVQLLRLSIMVAATGVSRRRRRRGGGLDAAEPASDRRRDRLAGDGEVVDRLAGLAAPELLAYLGAAHGGESSPVRPPEQLVPVAQLDARPAVGLAARALGSSIAPSRHLDDGEAASGEHLVESRRRARSSRVEKPARTPRGAAGRSRRRPSCSCR